MSKSETERSTLPDDLHHVEGSEAAIVGGGNPVSPHLRRVRAVLRFLRGPGIILASVLIIGVIVIKSASGADLRDTQRYGVAPQRFAAQDVVVTTELVSPPAFAVGGSCTGACRRGTPKVTINRVKERYWYRVPADGRSHYRVKR